MWTTQTVQPEPGRGWEVHLLRDGEPFAVISLDDWWDMSATTCLVDEVLRQEEFDFKMSELYGPGRTDVPMWTTNLVPADDGYDVHLLRDGTAAGTISLEEWAQLSATEWAIEDAVEVAEGLSQYGENIEEVKRALEQEERIRDGRRFTEARSIESIARVAEVTNFRRRGDPESMSPADRLALRLAHHC